ncbi:family 43 glycosylhydrolase [Aerococcaceae bacterium INB8]|uniref:Family 43 glycosylhydrolase n=1 Tax=Ruoffia halotolerans TaxID=2748684 RepID=A0A839A3Z0_9LACT|nr:glycoside hydrolase family 43 protein [Ruoffia halotolerans]MBA5728433.1 family 43 glycosylhydrolase [Ruoffia halotolerans]
MKLNKFGGLLTIFSLILISTIIFRDLEIKATESYQNPVGEMSNIGDPFVLKTNDEYYMYATSEPNFGFRVWRSNDLVDWVDAGVALDHRTFENKWATYDFWAPEVFEHENEYYMTYSARAYNGSLRTAIAKSESPTGPFEDINSDLIEEKGSYIDAHIFKDDDDKIYMYYVKDNSENIINGIKTSEMFVQEMSSDLSSLVGEPTFLFGPSQEWEGLEGDILWNEGPFVLKHEDKYYLTYSANYYGGPEYAVGYAVSDNPLGPFEKYKDNPILSSDLENGISGPGHNSITVGPNNEELYIVYHIHTDPDNPTGDRRMAIDPIYFEDGILKVDGPSSEEKEF